MAKQHLQSKTEDLDVLAAARFSAVENEFAKLLLARERKLVDLLVLAYRSGKGSIESYQGQIGAISELRRIRDEMSRQTRMAIQELETEYDAAD